MGGPAPTPTLANTITDISVAPTNLQLGVVTTLTLTETDGNTGAFWWCLQQGSTCATSCPDGGGWQDGSALAFATSTVAGKTGTIQVTAAGAAGDAAVLCMATDDAGAGLAQVSTALAVIAAQAPTAAPTNSSSTDGDASGALLASPLALTCILCLISQVSLLLQAPGFSAPVPR